MACSCSAPEPKTPAPGFRKALWLALWVNLVMFLVEGFASLQSGSVSLMADAIDFFGDSANYLLSLSVLGMGMTGGLGPGRLGTAKRHHARATDHGHGGAAGACRQCLCCRDAVPVPGR